MQIFVVSPVSVSLRG